MNSTPRTQHVAPFLAVYVGAASTLYSVVAAATSQPLASGSFVEALRFIAAGIVTVLPFGFVLAVCSLPYVAAVAFFLGKVETRPGAARMSLARVGNVSALLTTPLAACIWWTEKRLMAWMAYIAAWAGFLVARWLVASIRRAEFGRVRTASPVDVVTFVLLVCVLGFVQAHEVAVRRTVTAKVTWLVSREARRAAEIGPSPSSGGSVRQVTHRWGADLAAGAPPQAEIALSLDAYPCTVLSLSSNALADEVRRSSNAKLSATLLVQKSFGQVEQIEPVSVGEWKMPRQGVPGSITSGCGGTCACFAEHDAH